MTAGDSLPVAIVKPDGSIDHREMSVDEMDGAVFNRVISGDGKIVPISTQAQRIEEQINRKINPKRHRWASNAKTKTLDVFFGDCLVLRIDRKEIDAHYATIG